MTTRPARWFSYCDEEGFARHATPEAAQEAAEARLDDYREWSGDGWADEVHTVCWGELTEEAAETIIHQHNGDCEGEDGCVAGYSDTFHQYSRFDLTPMADKDEEIKRLRARIAELESQRTTATGAAGAEPEPRDTSK